MSDFTGEVHPVADLFPMLAEDELAELAEDIKANGLLQPVVLDGEGRLLDGRNRLAACEIAGVEPEFTMVNGNTDPDAYALSVNIARRHLTKGQQAMVAARWRLVSKQSQRSTAEATGLNAGRIGQAAVVLNHAPDLADSVVSGAVSLDSAYDTARQRKAEADSTQNRMVTLRAEAPDLADLVTEERMALPEAVAAARQRETEQRQERAAAVRDVKDGLDTFLGGVVSLVGVVPVPEWPVAHSDLDRADQALQLLREKLG